ncbi:hypothetical protein [Leuconostoc citreum]|uniref:hypothetical protein n=1 Tax=Leuconostoc citreum TaxID=33964 RepID=UPI000542B18F|nr:hypothetical protein [Leuconostoc citreum]CDX65915.1 Putative uncharacterized protein [Leuconostoc citreum]
MKKGTKKAITSPAKETVITDHKRPYHGFCYTHFNMDKDKNTKFYITLAQVHYINSLFDEPMFIVDLNKKTFQPVDEIRFHDWLDSFERGDQQ